MNLCIPGGLLIAFLMLLIAPAADASHGPAKRLGGGVERTTYMVGPLDITPGQNIIKYRPIFGQERPSVDGWITRIKPNLVREDGSVPLSSDVMFHHGVWLNLARPDATGGGMNERFYATGEEKTAMDFPDGFGYRYTTSDTWILNHMIHNLTPKPMTLYISYTVDFIPDSSPAAAGIIPVRPIWMDVQNGSNYPVFDVHRGDGGKDGKFTYPDDATDPYPPGIQKNEWTVDQDGVLMASVGHVHTGGLSTDLTLTRPGAKYAGPVCKKKKATNKKQRRKVKKAMRKCRRSQPKVDGDSVHIFHSGAHYFEPAGPVSWDVSMVGTKPNWRVAVKAGDTLGISTTYESKRASWYESMGIEITYMAVGIKGRNPFEKKVDYPGVVNHGHLPENRVHGGKTPVVGPDPSTLPNGTSSGGPFQIGGFAYEAGDFRLPGELGRPPVVHQGQSLTFELASSEYSNPAKGIWHSLTSCKSPCNRSTGIAYPIADGKFQFDSGQLGIGGAPTVNRTEWSTPADLPPGTYTYFCRIHPLMRGGFRVVN